LNHFILPLLKKLTLNFSPYKINCENYAKYTIIPKTFCGLTPLKCPLKKPSLDEQNKIYNIS
jgi:hypothetical protein